jgi:hypothetical protein
MAKQHAISSVPEKINGIKHNNAHTMQLQHILAQQCAWEHGEGRPRTRAPAAACFRVRCARESCFPARIILFFLFGRCESQPGRNGHLADLFLTSLKKSTIQLFLSIITKFQACRRCERTLDTDPESGFLHN